MSSDTKQDGSTEPAEPAQGTSTAESASVAEVDAAPFVDDIIIWNDKLDVPRKLTQEALAALPKLPTSMLPSINSLIKQGVTIAAIPTTSGIGAYCYLVNLATLKKPDEET